MKIIRLLFIMCLFSGVALSSAVWAEEPITLRIDNVDTSQFPMISAVVTVRNAFGAPVPHLTVTNFSVREDLSGKPRSIAAVKPVVNPDIQLSVVLAVDVSGSMQGSKLRDAQEASRRFLDGLSTQDNAALIAFAGAVDLQGVDTNREQPFGGELQTMYSIIDGLQAGGATPLYDTAFKAVQWAALQPPGNRAVVLFTDGREEKTADGSGGSRIANEDSPIREANRSGVPVFTIGLGDDADEMYLQRLALETGGIYQHAEQSSELAQLFANVSDLLKQQYRIQYQSELPGDGQTHQLRVDVEVSQHRAFDETSFTVPYIPTPTPVGATPEPTATPSPTATPTLSPLPTNTPAPTSTPLPSVSVANGPTPAIPLAQTWAPIVGALLLLFIVGLYVRRRRRSAPGTAYYCLRCGHEVPAPGAKCPSCGYQESFKETK